LRELPSLHADTTGPQHVALRIAEDNTHVLSESIGVNHPYVPKAYLLFWRL
jgi:hypothetical protein